jgi:hypothetical protein
MNDVVVRSEGKVNMAKERRSGRIQEYLFLR